MSQEKSKGPSKKFTLPGLSSCCQTFLLATICVALYATTVKCVTEILPPSAEPNSIAGIHAIQGKEWLENLIADEIIHRYLNSEGVPHVYPNNMLADPKEVAAKRFSEFVGKRFSEFVGKRSPDEKRFSEFVGKRNPEEKRFSEFVGKRSPLNKRFSEFVGKRFSEFVGKRSGENNEEKRFSEFVGK